MRSPYGGSMGAIGVLQAIMGGGGDPLEGIQRVARVMIVERVRQGKTSTIRTLLEQILEEVEHIDRKLQEQEPAGSIGGCLQTAGHVIDLLLVGDYAQSSEIVCLFGRYASALNSLPHMNPNADYSLPGMQNLNGEFVQSSFETERKRLVDLITYLKGILPDGDE